MIRSNSSILSGVCARQCAVADDCSTITCKFGLGFTVELELDTCKAPPEVSAKVYVGDDLGV